MYNYVYIYIIYTNLTSSWCLSLFYSLCPGDGGVWHQEAANFEADPTWHSFSCRWFNADADLGKQTNVHSVKECRGSDCEPVPTRTEFCLGGKLLWGREQSSSQWNIVQYLLFHLRTNRTPQQKSAISTGESWESQAKNTRCWEYTVPRRRFACFLSVCLNTSFWVDEASIWSVVSLLLDWWLAARAIRKNKHMFQIPKTRGFVWFRLVCVCYFSWCVRMSKWKAWHFFLEPAPAGHSLNSFCWLAHVGSGGARWAEDECRDWFALNALQFMETARLRCCRPICCTKCSSINPAMSHITWMRVSVFRFFFKLKDSYWLLLRKSMISRWYSRRISKTTNWKNRRADRPSHRWWRQPCWRAILRASNANWAPAAMREGPCNAPLRATMLFQVCQMKSALHQHLAVLVIRAPSLPLHLLDVCSCFCFGICSDDLQIVLRPLRCESVDLHDFFNDNGVIAPESPRNWVLLASLGRPLSRSKQLEKLGGFSDSSRGYLGSLCNSLNWTILYVIYYNLINNILSELKQFIECQGHVLKVTCFQE